MITILTHIIMIAIKTVVFFLAFLATLYLIEDSIENTILNMKKSEVRFHDEYTRGITHTLSGWLILLTTVLWTALYLLNQF